MNKIVGISLLIGGLLSSPLVAHADDNFFWPQYETQANHNAWAANKVGADLAAATGVTGSGIKVAVLDSGVAPNTPGVSNKVIAYKNFVPSQPPLQEHGTLTSSTVAADFDPATGIRGIAPGVSLIIGRVCYMNVCDNNAIRKAFAWAVSQGAQVISMSFGGGPDPLMQEEIMSAVDKGVVVVGAAGNSGCTPNIPDWGMNHECHQGINTEFSEAEYPLAGLIEVGASAQSDARASFSSWGPNLDILAPGVNTSAYDPNGATNGFGGTSAATPIVAGVAALILSLDPQLSGAQVQAILQASTTPAQETRPSVWDSCEKSLIDNSWQCGAIVPDTDPQQYFTGAGIVSASKAVELTRLIMRGVALSAPTVTQDSLTATLNWDGGPADVYVNSKQIASSVDSGYSIQGFESQSASIQIKRGESVSSPTLVLFATKMKPGAPTVSRLYFYDQALHIDLSNYNSLKDAVAINWLESGGVFRQLNGQEFVCSGQLNSYYPDNMTFNCTVDEMPDSFSGHFYLLGKGSVNGEPSALLNFTPPSTIPPISVETTYFDNGDVKFDWGSVSGALSYQYRFEQSGNLYCTDKTSFTATGLSPQPVWFSMAAFSSADCTGIKLNSSELLSYTALPPAPSKPSGITVTQVSSTFVEFSVPQEDFSGYWRIYRSDGLIMRENFGGRIIVGMQQNEDVNGLQFTYRFVAVRTSMWIGYESWSPMSDSISASFLPVAAPSAKCRLLNGNLVNCYVKTTQGTDGTLIEYLDGEMNVISSSIQNNQQSIFRIQQAGLPTAKFVRVSGTIGQPGHIDQWFRQGESDTFEITTTLRRSSAPRAL